MAAKTVSLVLGSGGARGLAHIGIIYWLNSHGFEIRSIAGSSIGALIGGIYAAGQLEVYERWVSALQRIDILKLLDVSFQSGLIKGDRIIGALKELVGDWNIEDLPISFTAVATDITEQKEVWLNRGPLFDAIRASIAIPGIFTPHDYRGTRLLDGSLVNPIPIAPTLNDKTELTIAVNLSGKPEPTRATPGEAQASDDTSGYHQRIINLINSLQRKLDPAAAREFGILDVLIRANETMQNTIARFKLAAYSPDVIVVIPRNACAFFEFYRAQEMIGLGRERAESALRPILVDG